MRCVTSVRKESRPLRLLSRDPLLQRLLRRRPKSFRGLPRPSSPNPHRPLSVEPLAPSRYKVQFTATAELRDKLERLRALLRQDVPDGDLGTIIERAVTEKLERLEARRFAITNRPRKELSQTDVSPSSRHIPAAVRRAVCERDGHRCRYVDDSGRRCSERDHLAYHHLRPFGLGGDHDPKNIRMMCLTHNAYLAEHDYGRQAMGRYRHRARGASQTVGSAAPYSPPTVPRASSRGA